MRGIGIAGLTLLAASAGYGLGWWARDSADAGLDSERPRELDHPVSSPRSAERPVLEAASPSTARDAGPAPTSPPPTPPTTPTPAKSPWEVRAAAREAERSALLDADPAFVEARIQTLAEQIRRGAEASIANAEATARQRVERTIAEERAKREDLLRGGTMEFLKKVGRESMFELVSSREKFAALFERTERGSRVDGETLRRETPLAPGDRITFRRGQFKLDLSGWRHRLFPSDIVIEGEGMDQTLVVLQDELDMNGDVRSLTLRDLTLHCNDNYMTDMRSGAHTIRLEGCRVIGFDMGAGGSVMLAASDCAFFASKCRFEACFGRSPGSGSLFRSSGALLVRLEECVVVGPFRSVWDGTCVCDRCQFSDMDPALKPEFEGRRGNGAVWIQSQVSYAESSRRPERRSVAELNGTWTDSKR